MKKEYRVRRNEEFKDIMDYHHYRRSLSFLVYWRQSNVNHDRVGISVSKKLGNAVMRNKIKRQLRMMIDEIFSFESGKDYIVIVKNNYLLQDFAANKKELSLLYDSVYNVIDKPKKEIINEKN